MSDHPDDHDTPPDPDFGPSGYLPERASKRARKIVLRAPLGLQWIIAAAVFGIIVVVAGVLWLGTSGPPTAPYVAVGSFSDDFATVPVTHLDDLDAWVVTAGPLMVVAGADVDALTYCEDSRRLQDGARVWDLAGRGLGTDSLQTHPAVVHDGTLYVDPTVTRPGARPAPDPEPPAC